MRRFALAIVIVVGIATSARATIEHGPIQISGNLQTQTLFRIQEGPNPFSAFNPVQQRNTFRLQYEHAIASDGRLSGIGARLPWIDRMDFLAYYRFAYDTIYDIAPGAILETHDGSPGGKISDFPGSVRKDLAMENVLREVFLDVYLADLPVSFRIGRQQIVWGEAIEYRALDSVNALDLSWHPVEAGVVGKVGFDELRIPAWIVKMLVDIGTVGPLSNVFLEAYDIPFDFNPAKVRFLPAPWSAALRNPFRPGLVYPLAPGVDLQACYDMTGNPAANSEANPDFSETAETGYCNSAGRPTTRLSRGLYDRRDPRDVNQFGVRLGAATPQSVNFTLNYMYRRHLGADIPTAALSKVQVGALNANPTGYVEIAPHPTVDPITRESHDVSGYVRLPVEFYYPYVHVFGVSGSYYNELTQAVYFLEVADTHKLPVTTGEQTGIAVKKKDVLIGAFGIERPTWIRLLNPRSTWLLAAQWNFNWITGHEKLVIDPATGQPSDGDVGVPDTTLIPGLYGDEPRVDRLKELESLLIVAASSFYRGGTFIPVVVGAFDMANSPNMAFFVFCDFLPAPNVIVTPFVRIFSTFGRTVDDGFGLGRASQWDEFQLKVTYQF